ncbi:MAG: hypothetical protein UE295_05170 [Acutalibacteraceae bacterium]|nr:hypothetical protein [Acutalibacteraceae bacterium]
MRKYGEEMDKMQQEAVRRMQEMQSRGKPRPPNEQPTQHNHSQKQATAMLNNSTDSCNSNNSNNSSCNQNSNNKNSCSSMSNSSNSSDGSQSGFFDSIFQDKERSLILMLLILLSTEKTDAGLMLALVYLLI